jgi:hypothetical protein
MHPKVFVKLKKTLKTLSSGQKTQKNPKKTHWAGFFFKKPGFFPTLFVFDVNIFFFFNNFVCTERVPNPTSLFLPTSFCM